MITASGHICIRRRPKDGKNGSSGVQGQIVRITEWQEGTTYHNDSEDVASPRFLDVVTITTGLNSFTAWQCVITHTSSATDKPSSSSAKWTPYNMMNPIYTSMLIAANAVFRFAQTNQLLVMKADGKTVNVGLGGGSYPIWIGAVNPTDAKFHVDEAGRVYAEDGIFKGQISASSGLIGGFYIFKDSSNDIHLMSIYGTVNGSASTDYTNSAFVPAIDFNGSKGTITLGSNFSAAADGTVNATNMNIENLDAHRQVWVDGSSKVIYRISFDASGINMVGDVKNNTKIKYYIPGLDAYAFRNCRYRIGDLWCKGQMGSEGRNCVEITGSSAYFHTMGQTGTKSGISASLSSSTMQGNTARIIPLIGSTTDAVDFPADVVIFQGDNSGYNYVLESGIGIGKTVIVANANDNKSTHLYVGGSKIEVNGGMAMVLVYVGTSMLLPSTSASHLGKVG